MSSPNENSSPDLSAPFPNVMIRASAGTGKTFRLSNRYLKLLVSGVDCQEILATTFSRKGAGEILDRVVQRLADAALSESVAVTLSQQLEVPLSQSQAADVLQQLMMNLHRLEIGTLDSFFNRVAKAFSLELGLPPSWEIVEDQQIDRLRVQTVQKILYSERVPTLLHLMVKGESSRRIASLIMQTVKDLYSTRRESLAEDWDRLPEPDGFLDGDQIAGILESAKGVQFAKGGKALVKRWDKVISQIADENWAELSEATIFQNILQGKLKSGNTKLEPEPVNIIQALIPHCASWITNRLIDQNRSTCELLGAYQELIEQTKDETGQLRFDDVTERLVKFVSMWNTARFSFRLDHQIKHLMLDEFQDTSPQQWSVIQPFAENVCCENDSSRSFFCVGDLKQAIFGWRGGVAEIFDLVDDKLDGIQQEILSTSFRSSQPVVDLTNSIFSNLEHYTSDNDVINGAVHSWQDWFKSHSTQRAELPGYASVEYADDAEKSTQHDEIIRARNANVQTATVNRVRQIIRQIPKDETHSIGILVRSNAEVGDLIFLLQQAGIQASEEGGNPLTDSAAVELILSAMQLADHPGDSIARYHVSHSPLANGFGLEPEYDSNRAENEKAAAAGAANMRRRLVAEGYGPTVESLARELVDYCTLRELTRLQHLVQLAFANRSDSERWAMRPSRFVKYIREEVKISDESSARVRVMTIHKSKGLEFDSVVLPQKYTKTGWIGHTSELIVGRKTPTSPIDTVCRYANESHRKLLPAKVQEIFEEDRKRTVREALCVLYVAITRAVHSVHVILNFGDKPGDKSAAGLLLSTLCPDRNAKSPRQAGVLFERGDPDWHQSRVTKPAENDSTTDLKAFYLESRVETLHVPLSKTPKSLRGMQRITPSALEGGGRVRLSETLMSDEKEVQFEVGTLMHGCYELTTWLEDGFPSDSELNSHLQTLAPGSPLVPAAIKSFHDSLEHENLLNLLSKVSYREQFVLPESEDEANRIEVFNERAFAIILKNRDSTTGELVEGEAVEGESTEGESEELGRGEAFTQGVIDRLVLVYENNRLVAADVIDFKSDEISDDNLTERIGFYRPQIETYRAAVAQTTGLELNRVSTKLVFVRSGQVIHLDMIENSVDGQTPLRVSKKKLISKPSESSKTAELAKPSVSTDPSKSSKAGKLKGPAKSDQPRKTAEDDSSKNMMAGKPASGESIEPNDPSQPNSSTHSRGETARRDSAIGKVAKPKTSKAPKSKTHTQKTLWSDELE